MHTSVYTASRFGSGFHSESNSESGIGSGLNDYNDYYFIIQLIDVRNAYKI